MPLIGDPATFLTFRSTTYVEADDSPSGSYGQDRGQVTRSIFVGWEARDQAALDFAGTATVLLAPGPGGPNSRRYVSRVLPHALPSKPHLRVQSVLGVKPMALRGNDGGLTDGLGIARYQMAEVGLQYVYPSFDFLTDAQATVGTGVLAGLPDEGERLAVNGWRGTRYVTRTTKFTTRELVLNRGLLKSSDGKQILEGVPIREASGEITYTHHQVPADAVPQGAWIAGGGCVNEFEFDGWPPGTLLASGMPETRPSPNVIDGGFYFDLTYRFQLLLLFDRDPALAGGPVIRGHNYIRKLEGTPGRFVPKLITTDGAGGNDFTAVPPARLMFPPFDFASFFRPDQP